MNWEAYENEIFEELRRRYPSVPISRNVKLPGRITHRKRQIDVLIETNVLDSPVRVIVDAKYRSHPIDVNDVEAFIGLMSDVEAHRGILISTNGYTATAIARAHNQPNQDIELDIFSLAELKSFQGVSAIPYSGDNGVLLDAPFGWVVDNLPQHGFVACLYQRGSSINAASKAHEWMYINFWKKESHEKNLDDLLIEQKKGFQKERLKAKLTILPGVNRADAKTLIRLAEVPSYPTPEYTGFVEFEDFIFFVVLFTPVDVSKRNLRKLREILRTVKSIKVGIQAKQPIVEDFTSRKIAGEAALGTPEGKSYMGLVVPYLNNALRTCFPIESATPIRNCSFTFVSYITENGQIFHPAVEPFTEASERFAKEFSRAWLPMPPKTGMEALGFPFAFHINIV